MKPRRIARLIAISCPANSKKRAHRYTINSLKEPESVLPCSHSKGIYTQDEMKSSTKRKEEALKLRRLPLYQYCKRPLVKR